MNHANIFSKACGRWANVTIHSTVTHVVIVDKQNSEATSTRIISIVVVYIDKMISAYKLHATHEWILRPSTPNLCSFIRPKQRDMIKVTVKECKVTCKQITSKQLKRKNHRQSALVPHGKFCVSIIVYAEDSLVSVPIYV